MQNAIQPGGLPLCEACQQQPAAGRFTVADAEGRRVLALRTLAGGARRKLPRRTGNVRADPQLDATGHLLAGSPAIDTGTPDPDAPTRDIDGDARPLDGDGDGQPLIDIAADEYL